MLYCTEIYSISPSIQWPHLQPYQSTSQILPSQGPGIYPSMVVEKMDPAMNHSVIGKMDIVSSFSMQLSEMGLRVKQKTISYPAISFPMDGTYLFSLF